MRAVPLAADTEHEVEVGCCCAEVLLSAQAWGIPYTCRCCTQHPSPSPPCQCRCFMRMPTCWL